MQALDVTAGADIGCRRRALGIHGRRLAALAGMRHERLSRIEHERIRPHAEERDRLLKLLANLEAAMNEACQLVA